MKKECQKKRLPLRAVLFLVSLVSFMYGCKDDSTDTGEYDPSKPVVFTGFSPTEGSVRTRLHIYGENFGTDLSKIHITIGGQPTTTIGSDGKEIYCMVPPRSFSGEVKISIDGADGETAIEHEFEQRFNYISKAAVGTLCGKVDEYGNASNVDGTFAVAEFGKPSWLLLDTLGADKCLYVIDPGTSMRKIDLTTQEVSTVLTNGQGSFRSMQYAAFDATGDTIFISDDNGQNNKDMMGVAYLLRSESFRKAQPYIYDRCGYSCTYQPLSQTLYYNTYWKAAVQRAVYDQETKGMIPEEVFPVYENKDAHSYLFTHPSGKYMYILGANCIYKSIYNEQTGKFQTPTVFAGKVDDSQCVDGPGTSARFNWPYQGTFVKNKDYMAAGKEDIYDFYMCDRHAHAIRKVTPEGIVSTYAGRGSTSSDGGTSGYIDGELRKEARFNEPCGIAYDEETATFYVCETNNHRIRTISIE